ncbi:S1 RNA-binding domain-containing protein [Clostridium felsineum]|uniref:30S ribosomal protein S1 n=1 Tax=Clostridium felsineum TaxID=36839 RepID=A0A1S8L4M5_9CLOT|nr:S1 RNA-binding domain-containing protein [Clostridium felsineum]MCR3761452.1 S1 RNA-binding domain-containing protein [Clostridium felsineum]URZ00647.1 30S ribosomal protein S1 [Clostridium felsineum]URZ06713.1 30S ribosomal protein S1 [Clostridium felsineum]URZ11746.1 30S ribosomal protein S1 [Clostridium felsineum]URZ16307.1 30S ribosomal protein S1 [Clostridium felsineum DSM 794]
MKNELNNSEYDIIASRQSKKILTGTLAAIENVKIERDENVDCGVVFYDEFKIFIPINEMNISREDKRVIRSMIGAEIDFIVMNFQEENKIAIASRKEAMELRKNLELKKHKVGDKISVRVTSVGRNNCRVDCYGIEYRVPINEIDYGYIDKVDKYVQVGDVVQAIIKELDLEKNIVVVSIKEAKTDPYLSIAKTLNKGGEYLGVVTGIKDYGIFLTIRKGVNCLCPFPNWSNFSPAIGEKFVVRIKSINYDEKKINANLMRPINQRNHSIV